MRKFLAICCVVVAFFDIWYISQKFLENKSVAVSIQAQKQQKNIPEELSTTPLLQQEKRNNSATDPAVLASAIQIMPQTPDQIFDYIDPKLASEKNTQSNVYTIIATGDVIPARSVNAALVRQNNFTFPFEKTIDVLRSADAVFINLESPLVTNCLVTTAGMSFCGDPRFIEGLLYAGVSVANIANNHAGNYGASGIAQTVESLKKNNISVIGNGRAATLLIRGKKFGFLGYTDIGSKEEGVAWANTTEIQKDIQVLKKEVDYVLVSFHWGTEYTATPTERQREIAYAAIDAGADLIIGNHPHWVQGTELYKGKHIAYAHGNYIFDQMWSQETREGVLGKYIFSDSGLIRAIYSHYN